MEVNTTLILILYALITKIEFFKKKIKTKAIMTYYGFYSENQKNSNKKIFIYQTSSGREVHVTEIRRTKNPNQNFPDTVFLGVVGRFLNFVDI